MQSVNQLALAVAGILITTVFTIPSAKAATLFSGTGDDAKQAFDAMKAAIGGKDNGNLGSQASGFRTIDWDGVRLDGTDFNGNTVVIDKGKTVGIPVNRFQVRGAIFEEVYAVSGDGFASVNPATTGEFPAFSPKNTFVMFDENPGEFDDRFIEQSFTIPGSRVGAKTRGFGAIFKDVELANTSSIEYFNGSQSLGKYFVPTGKSGETQFLGVLFDDAIVTDVTLTVGTNALFSFDGKTFQPFGAENLANGIDLAVTDDFIYAEPVPEPATMVGLFAVAAIGASSLKTKRKLS